MDPADFSRCFSTKHSVQSKGFIETTTAKGIPIKSSGIAGKNQGDGARCGKTEDYLKKKLGSTQFKSSLILPMRNFSLNKLLTREGRRKQ